MSGALFILSHLNNKNKKNQANHAKSEAKKLIKNFSSGLGVDFDPKEVLKMLDDYQEKFIPKATQHALNKTIDRIGTATKKELAKKLKVTQKSITPRMKKIKASIKRGLKASLVVDTKAQKLIETGKARQTRKGVRIGRKLYSGAFIATTASGHKGIFERSSKTKKRGPARRVKTGKNIGKLYKPELPIYEKHQSFKSSKHILIENGWRISKAQLPRLFIHEINRLSRKYR